MLQAKWLSCRCDTINIIHFLQQSCTQFLWTYLSTDNTSQDSFQPLSPLMTSSPNPAIGNSQSQSPDQSKPAASKNTRNRAQQRSLQMNSSTPHNIQMPKKENLQIMTINCRRIFAKKAEFTAVMDYVKPDIVWNETRQSTRHQHYQVKRSISTSLHIIQEWQGYT